MNSKLKAKHIISDILHYMGITRRLINRRKSLILGYHHIIPEKDIRYKIIEPGMYVTTETFEMHIDYLSSYYNWGTLDELVTEGNVEGKCYITFDDGWSDNYEYAYPILKKYSIPATIFISTNHINNNHWPWPERFFYYAYKASPDMFKDLNKLIGMVLSQNCIPFQMNHKFNNSHKIAQYIVSVFKELENNILVDLMEDIDDFMSPIYDDIGNIKPFLTWNQIKEMSENKIIFGAHTHNHVILTRTPLTTAREEIVTSKRELARNISKEIDLFCYPNGNFNQDIIDILKDEGLKLAVTTHPGFIHESSDLYSLRRTLLHNDISDSVPMLECSISRRVPFF